MIDTINIQLLRYCKDHMEIGGGQQITLPALYPTLPVDGLALGTMPVSTRVIAYTHMITRTVVAFVYMAAHIRCSAMRYGIEYTYILFKWCAGLFKCRTIVFYDCSQLEGWFTHTARCTSYLKDYGPIAVLCGPHANK